MAEEGTYDVLYLLAKNHVLVRIVDEVLDSRLETLKPFAHGSRGPRGPN